MNLDLRIFCIIMYIYKGGGGRGTCAPHTPIKQTPLLSGQLSKVPAISLIKPHSYNPFKRTPLLSESGHLSWVPISRITLGGHMEFKINVFFKSNIQHLQHMPILGDIILLMLLFFLWRVKVGPNNYIQFFSSPVHQMFLSWTCSPASWKKTYIFKSNSVVLIVLQ